MRASSSRVAPGARVGRPHGTAGRGAARHRRLRQAVPQACGGAARHALPRPRTRSPRPRLLLVLETIEAAGDERAAFVGHSYGGRLILELAALEPKRLERCVLLDPAVHLLPHVGFDFAERERVDGAFGSPQDAVAERMLYGDPTPLSFVEEDVREHLAQGPDGLYRYRYCRSAVITGYGELRHHRLRRALHSAAAAGDATRADAARLRRRVRPGA
ncbi:MAG: alpha/beta fold hydrolase [Actinobacteria bacterium]|nr:MAG: alpha/beta fold hydrolase [Actinomycetota bacterium]